VLCYRHLLCYRCMDDLLSTFRMRFSPRPSDPKTAAVLPALLLNDQLKFNNKVQYTLYALPSSDMGGRHVPTAKHSAAALLMQFSLLMTQVYLCLSCCPRASPGARRTLPSVVTMPNTECCKSFEPLPILPRPVGFDASRLGACTALRLGGWFVEGGVRVDVALLKSARARRVDDVAPAPHDVSRARDWSKKSCNTTSESHWSAFYRAIVGRANRALAFYLRCLVFNVSATVTARPSVCDCSDGTMWPYPRGRLDLAKLLTTTGGLQLLELIRTATQPKTIKAVSRTAARLSHISGRAHTPGATVIRVKDGLLQSTGTDPVSSRCFQCPTMAADRCTPSTIGSVTCKEKPATGHQNIRFSHIPHDGAFFFPRFYDEAVS
jgi:hypothetical protein